MRKKLIAALVVLAVLLACAVGVLIYLENRSADVPATEPGTEAPVDTTAASEEAVETTEEETVGITLETEDPSDVYPEETFTDEDVVPPVTVDPDVPATTEDPDSNELPPDEL